MTDDLPFRVIIGLVIGALVIIEVYYLTLMSQVPRAGVETVSDNNISALLPASLIDTGLLMVVIYVVLPQWMAWFGLALPTWLRWIGAGLAVGGLLLRFCAHRALGGNYAWYMRVHNAQQLVTDGPYGRVRHPMYSAAILLTVGLSLGTANWLIGALLIIPAVLTLAWRLDREEAMLLEKFGDEYRVYQQRTGRLLPRW